MQILGARRMWRRWTVACIAVVGVATLALPGVASADHWQFSTTYQLNESGGSSEVTCPTSTLCLTTGEETNGYNDVIWTNDPTKGASNWSYVKLEQLSQVENEPIDGVSCAPTGSGGAVYCVLADGYGNEWQTTSPDSTSASGWTEGQPGVATAYGQVGFQGASCWSSDCGLIDTNGDVLVTQGEGVLKSDSVFSGGPFSNGALGISCNIHPFCAATDGGPSLAWTSDPTSGGWQTSSPSGVSEVEQVSCPDMTLCVSLEVSNSDSPLVGVDTTPGGGTWTSTAVAGGANLASVTCLSATLCVLGGYGKVFTSTDPAGGASSWDESSVPISTGIFSIACPTSTECLFDSNGEIAIGTLEPGGSPGGGNPPPGGGSGPGTPGAGHLSTSGTAVTLQVSCSGTSGQSCVLMASLSAVVTSRGGKVVAVTASTKRKKTTKKLVKFGSVSLTVAAGKAETLKVSLNSAGKRLLAERHKLPAELVLSRTASGATKIFFSRSVTFKTKAKKK